MESNQASEEIDTEQLEKRKCTRISFKESMVMIAIVLSSISCTYCYDIPGSLQDALIKYDNLSYYYYSYFYSIYALPSIIFTILGGYMIDSKFGAKKSQFLFVTLMTLGCIMFAVGVLINSYVLMVLGRFTYGCGQEPLLSPVIFYYIMYWFKDTYSDFIFSVSDNLSNVGSILVFSTSNRILNIASNYKPNKEGLNITIIITNSFIIVATVGFLFISMVKPKNPHIVKQNIGKFTDCLKFPKAFWILSFSYSCVFNAIFTFESFSQSMLIAEYGMTASEANNPINLMNASKVVLAFPFGILVGYFGRNLIFFTTAVIICLTAHILLVYHLNPYIGYCMLGVGYSLSAASIWSMFGYLLEISNYGLGNGISSSILNITLFLYPIAAGKIIDIYGFMWVQIFFIIVIAIGLIPLILLRLLDRDNAIMLAMAHKERNTNEMFMKRFGLSTNNLEPKQISDMRSQDAI